MNNYEFYSNLQKYQENDIEHAGIGSKIASGLSSAYNSVKNYVSGSNKQNTRTTDFQPTYYQKIDNAYGPGKARYFYSKEEWDAYQRELQGYHDKAQQDVARQNNLRQAANNPGADRAAKESAVANAQNYKKQQEQAVKRRTSMQNMQSGREAAMKQGQQSTMRQTEEEKQRRAKFLESQQAVRDVKQKIGQNTIGQEQNKLREYNKNAQAAQNAQVDRANKESQKDVQRQNSLNQNQSSREAAIKKSNIERAVSNILDDVNKNNNGVFTNDPGRRHNKLIEYAKKYNVDPDDLSVAIFMQTGWLSMDDVNKVAEINKRNKKG